jgi:hypothetical protein
MPSRHALLFYSETDALERRYACIVLVRPADVAAVHARFMNQI